MPTSGGKGVKGSACSWNAPGCEAMNPTATMAPSPSTLATVRTFCTVLPAATPRMFVQVRARMAPPARANAP